MRNLVIFLYFVFLFKLTFAQSLSGIPGLGSGTVGQGVNSEAPRNQNSTQLAQANVLPENIELPSMDEEIPDIALPDLSAETGISIGGDENQNTENLADQPIGGQQTKQEREEMVVDNEIPELPPAMPELPDLDLAMPEEPEFDELIIPEEETAQDNLNIEPANEIISTETTEEFPEPEFLDNQQAKEEISEIEVLKPKDFEAITLEDIGSEISEDEQFPDMPDLGFNPEKNQQDNKQSVLTPEQKEEQLQDLLQKLLPKEEKADSNVNPLIIEKEKKKEIVKDETIQLPVEEEEEEEVIPSTIATDYENLGKPGRVGYKPITYSEDQLNEQFVKAAIIGNKQAVIDLLHSGRPANAKNKFGETPLMAAIYNNHNDVVEILLVEGADANIQDVRGNTPLHIAAAKKNYFATQQLIRNGAIIDARNRANDTPLLLATLNGYIDIVDLLVREGADVNKANDDGLSPLHVASYNGNSELVKYLLYVGANANMVNREGYKPYDLAYGRHLQIAQILSSYTNSQKYVSKELPKIIQYRNENPTAKRKGNYNDPYIMFPKAYQQNEVEDRQSYSQQQIDWWAAKKQADSSVANVETSGMSTLPTNSIQNENIQQNTNISPAKSIQNDTPPVTYNLEYSKSSETPKVFVQEEPEIKTSAVVKKVKELQNNRDIDPMTVNKSLQYTEAAAPRNIDENIKRSTELVENKVTKMNKPLSMQASSLGGNIKKQDSKKNIIPKSQKQKLAKVESLNFQPKNKSVTYDARSRYSSMSSSQQKQWDVRLERWVRSGLREYNMNEKDRVLWKKQGQVLRKVYMDMFDEKVKFIKNSYAGRIKSSSYSKNNPPVPSSLTLRRKVNSNRYRRNINNGYASR